MTRSLVFIKSQIRRLVNYSPDILIVSLLFTEMIYHLADEYLNQTQKINTLELTHTKIHIFLQKKA